MTSAVLTAPLLIPIGIPLSGRTRLAEQLIEVGLISRDAVLDADAYRLKLTGSTLDPRQDEEVLLHYEFLLRSRASHKERTYFRYSFLTLSGLENLLSLVERLVDQVCVIAMDTARETILSRARSGGVPYNMSIGGLEMLYDEVQSFGLDYMGYPIVSSSILSIAVEGQDEW